MPNNPGLLVQIIHLTRAKPGGYKSEEKSTGLKTHHYKSNSGSLARRERGTRDDMFQRTVLALAFGAAACHK